MSKEPAQPTEPQSTSVNSPSFYVVGGSIRPGTPSYIERAADEELYRRVLAGEFCYVLTPRQMGKSSLMARTVKKLRDVDHDVRTAILDLSSMGGEPDKPDAWYYGLGRRLVKDLEISVDFKSWWQERIDLPALQRLSETFDLLLSKTTDRLVVFVDEIDWTIRLPYSDDFFAVIRACYNARAIKPEYQRLTFVLLGVASPSDLIKDTTRTPFNIGHRVELTDFTPEEAKPLEKGLHQDATTSEIILKRILYWTAGHPYLTQKLCDLLTRTGNGSASEQMVDQLVQQHFLNPEAGRAEQNLTFVRDRILRAKRTSHLLKLYLLVRRGKSIPDDPRSPIHSALKLSGLVVPRDGRLSIRNRIYQEVFTERWAKGAMPANWNQRMAVASMALLLLGFGVWYEVLQARPFVDELRRASEDYPIAAYNKLRNIPGYTGKADTLLAEYWDRRAVKLASAGERDNSLISRLVALRTDDQETRRREANGLVGADYKNLNATFRHGDHVTAAAFSPNGKLALTGSWDNTARLWQTETGTPVGPPLRHENAVRAVAFSPDGKLALTGSDDRTARLWRTETGTPVRPPLRHENAVRAVAFSPDGKLALTGSDDRTARLWRTETGTPVGPPLRHENAVRAVAFSPDGKLALTGSWDNTARLWQTETGTPVGPPLRHEGAVQAVVFSPDGRFALTGSMDGTARLWQTETGTPVGPPLRHEGAVQAVVFSPNGRFALTGSADGTVRLWQTATGTPVGPPLRHEGAVQAVAFSPDGRFALTGSADGTVRLWQTETGTPVGPPLRHESAVWAVAFSPDGKLALTGSWDNTARLWRTETGTPVGAPLRHENFVMAVAFSPDGTRALTGSMDRTARLWRTATGTPIGPPLRHENAVRAVAFSPDGKLALTGSVDDTARLWQTETGTPVGPPFRHEGTVWAVAFSPDGKLALTGSMDGTARLWQTATGTPVGPPLRHEGTVTAVAFSPDGKLALTGSVDDTARLWQTATGTPVGPPLRHENAVRAVAFSPNGRFALTGSEDGTARLWQTATGTPVGPPLRHQNAVTAVAFSPNGQFALTATRWWAHFSELSQEGFVPTANLLLPGTWAGGYRFLDATSESVQLALRTTAESVMFGTFRLDASEASPMPGKPEDLIEEWQKKLALKLETGKIVPLYEIPVVARDGRSRGGSF